MAGKDGRLAEGRSIKKEGGRPLYNSHLCLPQGVLASSGELFSRSVVSDNLQPHGLQHSRLPCPSPSPRACSNSCPLSW